MLTNPLLWLGSKANITKEEGGSDEKLMPLKDEKYIMIDWSLPLQPRGQVHLFSRWTKDFEKSIVGVKVQSHSKYRRGWNKESYARPPLHERLGPTAWSDFPGDAW